MTEKPFISIIVPYYNTPEKFFRRCVDSVERQTYGNYEMIVVDDGSSQEHKKILDKIVGTNSKIRVLHKENEGSAVARNVGVQSAWYDYIMFLDSDDAITEYCLEEVAEAIMEEQPDLVLGLVRHVNEEEIESFKDPRKAKTNRLRIDLETDKEAFMSHMIGWRSDDFVFNEGYIADGPVARVLKKAIAVTSLFSTEAFWNDDTIWNICMVKQCKHIVIVDALWYKYYINSTSKTRKFRPNCPYEFQYRTKQELILVRELWPNCLQGVYHRIFYDILILCKTYLFHPSNPLSRSERYKAYIECIHGESYREALGGISFRNEKRLLHRLGKEIIRLCSYHGPHAVSYWILGLYYRRYKDIL